MSRRLPLPFDPRGLVVPVLLVAAWQLAVSAGWVDARVVVPPVRVLEAGAAYLASGELLSGVVASLARNLAGFAAGSLAGIALGALLSLSRPASELVGPTLAGLKHISVFAWLPLISTFLGNGEPAKFLFIALAAFYPMALATLGAFAEVEPRFLEVARVHGFSRWQRLRLVLLPAAAPRIFAGLHLALLLTWMATIGAEYLLPAFTAGVGNIVMRGKAAFHVEVIVLGLLAIGLVGAALSRIATRIESRVLRWRP